MIRDANANAHSENVHTTIDTNTYFGRVCLEPDTYLDTHMILQNTDTSNLLLLDVVADFGE